MQLVPFSETPSTHPALTDPLAAYYFGPGNPGTTDESDVLRMLDNFWKGFVAEARHDKALAVMELAPPASHSEIRAQYRRFAMQWHPGRGGETEQFQRLGGVLNQNVGKRT